MANAYWNKESGVNAAWATHDQNWWNNVLHRSGTDELGAVPSSGDALFFLGSTAPADDGLIVSYLSIDTSELTANFTFTSDITVTGSLVLGVPGGTEVHVWSGDANSVNNALIQGASVISSSGFLGKDAVFRDTASINDANITVGTNIRFYDSSGATGGTLDTNIFCYGTHSFTEADSDLVITGATFFVYGTLTINNTAANTLTGTPTIRMMNRNAQFLTVGTVAANVVPYRLAQAHRLRYIG